MPRHLEALRAPPKLRSRLTATEHTRAQSSPTYACALPSALGRTLLIPWRSAKSAADSAESGPSSTNFRLISTSIGRHGPVSSDVAQSWSNSTRLEMISTTFETISTNIGRSPPTSLEFDKVWAAFSQIWPSSARFRPISRPSLPRLGPDSTRLGPYSTRVGSTSANFCRIRKARADFDAFGQLWATLDPGAEGSSDRKCRALRTVSLLRALEIVHDTAPLRRRQGFREDQAGQMHRKVCPEISAMLSGCITGDMLPLYRNV